MRILLALLFFGLFSSAAQARDITLSFDDCPRKAGPVLKPMDRDQKIVDALKTAGITAVFFCNSPSGEERGLERLKLFAANGHLIANHTADHPDLDKMTVAEFIKNIDQAHNELQSLPNFRKWFRFPFLHEGKNEKDVAAVRAHLKKSGYTNGYVTVDTQDWYVDEVLRQKVAAGKKYDQAKLCKTYADMMSDEAELSDKISIGAIGRSVKQVILLHETDLNALCLADLIQNLKTKKWVFGSPDVAYQDPIAMLEPLPKTPLNNGRVYALAKEAGYKGPYFSKWVEETAIEKELESKQVWK